MLYDRTWTLFLYCISYAIAMALCMVQFETCECSILTTFEPFN